MAARSCSTFPAPGVSTSVAAALSAPPASAGSESEVARFLSQVANAVLPGPDRTFVPAPSSEAVPPLPLHARTFLSQLPALPGADAIMTTLKPLLSYPATVSRARRAALILGCAVFPIIAGLGFSVAGRMMSNWQKQQPEITILEHLFQQRSMAELPWVEDGHKGPDDRMLAIYIAHNYRGVITNPASWSSIYAVATITGEDRQFAEDSLKAHPNPTEEEIKAATAAISAVFAKAGWFRPLCHAVLPAHCGRRLPGGLRGIPGTGRRPALPWRVAAAPHWDWLLCGETANAPRA